MLKYITFSVGTLSFVAFGICELKASPMATQNWVRNYVATNASGGVSRSWVRDYVASNNVAEAGLTMTNTTINVSRMGMTACQILLDDETNSVERAIDSIDAEFSPVVDYIFDNTIGF